MFSGCTNLVNAPELPATTVEGYCYRNMFYNCTSLVNAPTLPATTLADYCYYQMFHGCSKLNYIKMLATDISAYDCLYGWVYNVASSGTFVKHPDMTTLTTGTSGIPSGWTVVNDGEESGGTYDGVFGEIPPESTEFGWPLYITVPYEEDFSYGDIVVKTYSLESNEITQQLLQWTLDNYVEGGYEEYYVYPPELYINGILVTGMYTYDPTELDWEATLSQTKIGEFKIN